LLSAVTIATVDFAAGATASAKEKKNSATKGEKASVKMRVRSKRSQLYPLLTTDVQWTCIPKVDAITIVSLKQWFQVLE
jgi:hypothetical protein